jgi:hypothetical protein
VMRASEEARVLLSDWSEAGWLQLGEEEA